jgi:hypothetical protein
VQTLPISAHRSTNESGSRVLSFLADTNGVSQARSECQNLHRTQPREIHRILAHVSAVDHIGGDVHNNDHLKQATANPGIPPQPDLYWWEVNGVGAFYAYDGSDLVVVLMGMVSNPPTYGELLSWAQRRL